MQSYSNFFSHEDADIIKSAIRTVEGKTSGEVRVHVEEYCNGDVIERARYVFFTLGMDRTKEDNGVLFYLSIKDKEFAVWGGEGIHQKVASAYWKELTLEMEREFRASHFVKGLCDAIHKVSDSLAKFFPIKDDDVNELSDEISVGQL